MADEPDNLVLEHLRHIRAAVERLDAQLEGISKQFDEIKSRFDSFAVATDHAIAQIDSRLGPISP